MVISTIGIPPWEIASVANRASSAEDKRMAGTMPISSMRARTSSFFIETESFRQSARDSGPSRDRDSSYRLPNSPSDPWNSAKAARGLNFT